MTADENCLFCHVAAILYTGATLSGIETSAVADRITHHLQLLDELHRQCVRCLETDPLHNEQANRELLDSLEALRSAVAEGGDYGSPGQALIARIVAHYPALTSAVHRDLFWFFGGDCLHFMSDEEIALYQRLDEMLHEQGADADYSALRTQVFGFH